MRLLAAALFAGAIMMAGVMAGGLARADDTVTIGAVYPLTVAGANAGNAERAAIVTAAEIVNTPHKGLESLPLGAGQGLPALGGAKIAAIFADDLGNPSVAQSQALRLIGQDRVAALIGGGALSAAAVAERRGVPFLVPDAAAPNLAGRGFTWGFRTAPLAGDAGKSYGQFLAGLKQAGSIGDGVALLAEKTAGGTAEAAALDEALKAAGFNAAAHILFPPNAADLSRQAVQLRNGHADTIIVIGHADDAILLAKTLKTLDYKPKLLIGDGAVFTDPAFVAAVGNLAQGVIGRSVWEPGKPDSPAAIVNGLYKAKAGRDLDDAAANAIQGFLVLADAINRAGSTDPAAIRKALRDTELPPAQLIVGYDGVKFDETGRNSLAATYLVQLQGKQFTAVWPQARATGKLALPFRGWE
jgi:branched-chain amino acid transport system substrate-binding protein